MQENHSSDTALEFGENLMSVLSRHDAPDSYNVAFHILNALRDDTRASYLRRVFAQVEEGKGLCEAVNQKVVTNVGYEDELVKALPHIVHMLRDSWDSIEWEIGIES